MWGRLWAICLGFAHVLGSVPRVWPFLPFVLGRAVSAPFLGAGRAWQSLWSLAMVAFASRTFSQSKLTKCFSSQAKISQRWKNWCRGSPGAVVSLTQQVPDVWLSLCLGRALFSEMGCW